MIANSVDPEGLWLYRVGGITAIVLVVGYFLTFPIYFWVGDPQGAGVEVQLAYFAEHAAGWWAIAFLMVFTDLLLVPIYFGIYMALKHVNKGLTLMALAFAALVASATYASVIKDSPLASTYAILIPSLGVLFAGLVMLKGVFSKVTGYIALAVALTGILFMGKYFWGPLAVLRYINALLAMVFYLLVGFRLYKLSRL